MNSALCIIIVPLVTFMAAFVQGASGFGFGLVCMALFLDFMGVRDASVIVTCCTFCLNLVILSKLYKHFQWKGIVPLYLSVMIAIPIGVFFMAKADPVILKRIMGAVLILGGVYGVIPTLTKKKWHPVRAGIPCGFLSGLMAGAFSTGGPPLVAYLSTQRFSRYRYSATLQVMFFSASVLRMIMMQQFGLIRPGVILLAAVGMVTAVIGSAMGLKVLTRLSDKTVRLIAVVFLLIWGIRYVFL
ncbi:MAG TPA: sulfite exporter TauE/SafE family protein [Candidatus Brocadiia bacterium]|nr:sulfite exporter TauE/SafE family protein [Candidatus Brocadiia bacterium]